MIQKFTAGITSFSYEPSSPIADTFSFLYLVRLVPKSLQTASSTCTAIVFLTKSQSSVSAIPPFSVAYGDGVYDVNIAWNKTTNLYGQTVDQDTFTTVTNAVEDNTETLSFSEAI